MHILNIDVNLHCLIIIIGKKIMLMLEGDVGRQHRCVGGYKLDLPNTHTTIAAGIYFYYEDSEENSDLYDDAVKVTPGSQN